MLISLSITSAKPSHDATERAREAFAAQRDRDRATWGRGYRVLDVGNDAYSGYSAIGGDGKAKATVRLKRPDLGGQASGVSLVVLQHSRDLFPKCSPWAAPVAAGEAAYLRVHHHRPPVDREIGHRSLAPRMDVGGLNGTSRARDQALSAAGPYPDSLAFIRYIVDDQAGQP
nr:hypothetical protein [Actinomadura formosensis]